MLCLSDTLLEGLLFLLLVAIVGGVQLELLDERCIKIAYPGVKYLSCDW